MEHEKYTLAWAKEKRETCKLCQRKEGFGFCRRHAPRMVVKKTRGRTYPITKAFCLDCFRPYGNEHGFPDLIITNDAWRQISPNGDEGGLLCPSCICARLEAKGIKSHGAFMSGPIMSVSEATMWTMRTAENCWEALLHNNIPWGPPPKP